MSAHLADPHPRYAASFISAMQEATASPGHPQDEGRAGDDTMVGRELERWGEWWGTPDGFQAYVNELLDDRVAPHHPGLVPSTTLWWVEGTDYLGRIAVRHELTDHLREVGGHIGYDVRRSARRRGHATAMLRAVLPTAAVLGIDPALVTCDDTNVASRKVIEAAGGRLEDQRGVKLRFWVPTA